MSDRERIIQLLDEVPAYKLGYVLAYVQGLTADEDADDAYCEQLLKEYQNDPDPHKTDAIPLEQLAQELGIAL